jgi:deazaflavin-dependent oxidoreductase (nitroreductase family)
MRRRTLIVLGVAVVTLLGVALVVGLHDMAGFGRDGDAAPVSGSIGERLAAVADRPTLLLTHRGRRSGKAYGVTIWFVVDGETVYLTTMNKRRQWVRNVGETPRVGLQIGRERFEGTVSPVIDAVEKRREYDMLTRKYWIMRIMDAARRLTGRDPGANLELGSGAFFRVELRERADPGRAGPPGPSRHALVGGSAGRRKSFTSA